MMFTSQKNNETAVKSMIRVLCAFIEPFLQTELLYSKPYKLFTQFYNNEFFLWEYFGHNNFDYISNYFCLQSFYSIHAKSNGYFNINYLFKANESNRKLYIIIICTVTNPK